MPNTARASLDLIWFYKYDFYFPYALQDGYGSAIYLEYIKNSGCVSPYQIKKNWNAQNLVTI